MVAVVVVPLVIALAAITTTGQQSAEGAADEIVDRIGSRTVGLVSDELHGAVDTLDRLALLVDGEMLDERGARLDEIFAAQLRTFPQLSGVFVGFPDGGFRFVRRVDGELVAKEIAVSPERRVVERTLGGDLRPVATVEIDDDYDPRSRPWYDAAAESETSIWTEPYVFFSSGEPGVTAALAVSDDADELLAVLGVDLAVADLRRFLDDLPIDDTAAAFLIAGDRVVAAPSGYPLTSTVGDRRDLATLSELDLGVTDGGAGRVLRGIPLDDERLPAWTVIVRTERIEFVDVVRRQTRIALGALAIAAVVLIAAIVVVVRRLRRPIDELGERADLDPLTRLPNRQALHERGKELVDAAHRDSHGLVVAVLDIDAFKLVNDRHGHPAGDAALAALAEILRDLLRPGDLAGRLGGDEFVIVLTRVDRHAASWWLDTAKRTIEARLHEDPATETSTITVGATELGGRGLFLRDLIGEADARLLAAKRIGKNSIAWAHLADDDRSRLTSTRD